MKRSRRRSRAVLKDLVVQRIEILYEIAVQKAKEGDWDYAARLGSLIKEMSTTTRVRPPRWIKKALCKRCNLPLIPGVTASLRLRSQGRFSYIVIRCARCGWIHRRPYKKGGQRNAPEEREESKSGASR
ncbi:MAG: ribonuclease P Rpr2/Rpp21/SNM1 subunit [Desulfurococcales archaeon]|nr:ribonuclease P Rpr2/Rpp21/SNM1 subunit [Desulfurococcales archaeon]